jgi:hypothetical protein
MPREAAAVGKLTFSCCPQARGSRDSSFSCSVVKPGWTQVDAAMVCLHPSLLTAPSRSPKYDKRARSQTGELAASMLVFRFGVSLSKRPIPGVACDNAGYVLRGSTRFTHRWTADAREGLPYKMASTPSTARRSRTPALFPDLNSSTP